MSPALKAALTGNRDYDELPESIKADYSYTEWQWLSGEQKARLLQTETEPEWDE